MITIQDIIEIEKDMAGYWRVWIRIKEGELKMLKFKTMPNIMMIQTEIDKYLNWLETAPQRELEDLQRQKEQIDERIKSI